MSVYMTPATFPLDRLLIIRKINCPLNEELSRQLSVQMRTTMTVARFESQAENKNHGWAIVTWMNTPEYPSLYMTNDANEKVLNDGIKLFGIPYGEYKVVETVAPEGCTINDKDAVIKFGKDGDRTKSTITYYEPSKSGNTVSYKSVTELL